MSVSGVVHRRIDQYLNNLATHTLQTHTQTTHTHTHTPSIEGRHGLAPSLHTHHTTRNPNSHSRQAGGGAHEERPGCCNQDLPCVVHGKGRAALGKPGRPACLLQGDGDGSHYVAGQPEGHAEPDALTQALLLLQYPCLDREEDDADDWPPASASV